MIRHFLLFALLFTGALLLASPSWADEQNDEMFVKTSKGVDSPSDLFASNANLWPTDKDKETLIQAIEATPNKVASRGLGKLLKTILMSPVVLNETDNIDALKDVQDVTAARIQKLIDMGAFNEAQFLVKIIGDEDVLSPSLMTAIANSHIALGNIETACLDILSFKSNPQNDAPLLDPVYKTLVDNCSGDLDLIKPDIIRHLSFDDVKNLDDLALSVALYGGAVITTDNRSDGFDLRPYAQSKLMRSEAFPLNTKLKHLGAALSHDIITPQQAQALLTSAITATDDTQSPQILFKAVDDKVGIDRLIALEPLRTKELSDEELKELTAKVTALAVTSSPYNLLTYASRNKGQIYGFDALDYNVIKSRKAFIAGLVQALSNVPPVGNGATISPNESSWVWLPLSGLTDTQEGDLQQWSENNLDNLSLIAPELAVRLSLIFQALDQKKAKNAKPFDDYVNKNSLTSSRNYVMHNDDALNDAKKIAKNEALGLLASQLAQVNKNETMDQIDPEIVADMMTMLLSAGLKKTAHDIAIESLANLTIIKDAELGEQQNKEKQDHGTSRTPTKKENATPSTS